MRQDPSLLPSVAYVDSVSIAVGRVASVVSMWGIGVDAIPTRLFGRRLESYRIARIEPTSINPIASVATVREEWRLRRHRLHRNEASETD